MFAAPFICPENLLVMRFFRPQSWFASAVLVGIILAAGRSLASEDDRPVAVVSIASTDQLLNDFAYLTRIAGRSDVGGFIQMAGASFVADLDRTKPLGLYVTMENDEPKGVAFLCVPDSNKLLRGAGQVARGCRRRRWWRAET